MGTVIVHGQGRHAEFSYGFSYNVTMDSVILLEN